VLGSGEKEDLVPKWTKILGETACGSASCPAIHLSDDGRLYVQGNRVGDDVRAALELRTEEDAVEIPCELLERAARSLRSQGAE
jgi:hypothetical protein